MNLTTKTAESRLHQDTIKRVIFLIVSFYCLYTISGCRSSTQEQSFVDELKNSAKSLSTKIEEESTKLQNTATEELKGLFAVEYKVVDLPSNSSREQIEKELTTLGEERWNCSYVDKENGGTRLLCKRLPPSYLKLVPLLF
jgi:hypothetical protein